jgi:hypothetical protein
MLTNRLPSLFASFAVALATLGAMFVGNAPAQAEVPVHGFQTPSKNINCTYYEYDEEPAVFGCEIRGYSGPSPVRPRDCEFDWNPLPLMGQKGKATLFACVSDTRWWVEAPVVKYGSTWKYGPFRCSVATTGVTCTNLSGRGFVLRRSSVKAI